MQTVHNIDPVHVFTSLAAASLQQSAQGTLPVHTRRCTITLSHTHLMLVEAVSRNSNWNFHSHQRESSLPCLHFRKPSQRLEMLIQEDTLTPFIQPWSVVILIWQLSHYMTCTSYVLISYLVTVRNEKQYEESLAQGINMACETKIEKF